MRAKGLSSAQQARNLDTLKFISQTAAEFGVDFTLGIWEHDVQPRMTPSVEGLDEHNIGPYSHAALEQVLAACPAIRSVQMRTNLESGIPSSRQVEFYRDWIFPALRDSGRLVKLDLRGGLMQPGLMDAALAAKVPLRSSTKFWAEHLGRSWPPAETFPNYSFLHFLEKPGVPDRQRPWRFYFELWELGSHRLLQWGDPDCVRQAVPWLTLSGAEGFEIDPPLAQKGFGNRAGTCGVFTPEQQSRVFWKYEWQRYWLFYQLWGRLTYNPAEPDRLWLDEFLRRFGNAGKDVFEATRHASKVLHEIVSDFMPDPNMYVWPEIDPGPPLEKYVKVPPSDWRFVSKFDEQTQNRLKGMASAKQSPLETAARLHEIALLTEQAVERAQQSLGDQHQHWSGVKPDLQVLALLARYHGRKRMAADHLSWFQATGDETSLYAARRELNGSLRIWQDLVKLTDGLYPAQMEYGPSDIGH